MSTVKNDASNLNRHACKTCRTNMKYDAIAVLKLPGNIAPSHGETACQKSPRLRRPTARHNADLIEAFSLQGKQDLQTIASTLWQKRA